ncbi:glycosyltransferase [Flavobacterium collinsii]|uniref:Uncharacterized protein n=1 Tax=Flavobacterium collinsii TaxID=1114861 RepID=A0A9W4TCG1_9FLAO|nr:hypothetical protein [Flavobacterium collinsii]CAA9202826.1 hypothetical protein FLACOL7796_04470 [Flavobacterium collinsii]CAI2765379.1 conserved protein of unknown function [Flavobacterium collinsii]
MKTKVYVYGLCDVFYDGYYIQGIKELYKEFEFNIAKFPKFNQGTFAFIVEKENYSKKIIIDSKDSNQIHLAELEWCDVYGKVNCNEYHLPIESSRKIMAIGPSFGVRIWSLLKTLYYLFLNFIRFKNSITNKREFVANYWRQYKRLQLKSYHLTQSSKNEVFFLNSIWKKESETNKNRALFIETCKNSPLLRFEGGFVARSNGDNLGLDDLVYSKTIPLRLYIKKSKRSAFVFNTPAVLSCHGWKLAEFLALGKAIITTSHRNKLPEVLVNEKHLMYVENQSEINQAIEKLTTDVSFKRKLEVESRNYFDTYLTPCKVISRLIEKK